VGVAEFFRQRPNFSVNMARSIRQKLATPVCTPLIGDSVHSKDFFAGFLRGVIIQV
jgi:hypothetical protein